MNKILVVCGPTATGKTALAIKLAQKYHGEIISADSRQVYKGMDIGTGKDLPDNSKFIVIDTMSFRPSPELVEGHAPESISIKNSLNFLRHSGLLATRSFSEVGPARRSFSVVGSRIKEQYSLGYYLLDSIPLWLLDIVPPNQSFSVAEYENLAWIVIRDIWNRGKLPILVGGTGLYLKAVLEGIETTGIPPNPNLRSRLEKISPLELQKFLKDLNPEKWESMNSSDQKNPRRLIRAIEITYWKNLNHPNQHKHSLKEIKNEKYFYNLDFLILGITASHHLLYQNIDERVEKRVKQGIVNEIKSLLHKGYSWNLPSMSGLGYRVWQNYFLNIDALDKTVQKWKFLEHAYARRQLTWFKKDQRIRWFDIRNKNILKEIENYIIPWLN